MRSLLRIALCAGVAGLAVLGWVALDRSKVPSLETQVAQRYSPAFAAASDDRVPPGVLTASLIPYRLQDGQTLDGVLDSLGVPPEERLRLIEIAGERVDLRRLRPGNLYRPYFHDDLLTRFDLAVEDRGELKISRAADGWTGAYREFERDSQLAAVRGRLEDSFERAVRESGAEPQLAYKIAKVFQWDLDFNRDLRVGDEFEVIYERVYLDGQYSGLGDVVAAVYRGGNRELRGYRYGEDGDYYDAGGRPLKKMFLRSPMEYSRVTSRFSRRRFHPVLKRYRPHYGVDYGAPTGTPVRVTATGTVTMASWNGGAGRMVKVRHPNSYQTAYLHLSRFARGVTPGARVQQGEVIGYVGSSGLATGPHLDYRVEHRGRWIDPQSLDNMPADPIPMEHLAQFEVWRDLVDQALTRGEVDAQLAAAFTPTSSIESAS